MTDAPRPELSVVVPTLDEADTLPGLLSDLRRLGPGVEIVIVDGGSSDGTREIAARSGARVLRSRPSRGLQLSTGAAEARGRHLLFLHADTRLPPPARCSLSGFLADTDGSEFGHFGFRLDRPGRAPRWIEWGQRIRERLFGLPYGDQGLLVSRDLYVRVGGYPDWPLFEDVELVRRLSRVARRRRLAADVPTSARRFSETWPMGRSLGNSALFGLYLLGVSPHHLVKWYDRRTSLPLEARRTVVVFAKAPRLGTVKTRLARDVGAHEALRIYRVLGRRIADEARRSGYHTVVAYTPETAEKEVRAWLGDDLEYQPQPPGDLGERMHSVWNDVLDRGAPAACLIGTDLPSLTASHLRRAFSALDRADLVTGPATDGGYYLIGGSKAPGVLFRGIPWSTDRVHELTLRAARRAGMSTTHTEPLSDVDTVADLPPELRAG